MSSVTERIAALRDSMKRNGVDAFLIPTEDFHGSEYVGEHFKCRRYITGFTGSAGTALIGQDYAMLWTDGRYFLQAEKQLEGSGVTLQKMGEKGVPTIEEFISKTLTSGQVLGCDGRTLTDREAEKLNSLLGKVGASLKADADLVGEIWEDRPPICANPVWELDTFYTGKDRREKLEDIRGAMKENCADHLLITSLDDIAWTLNLRGDDVECNPVFMSYLLISENDACLYAQEAAFSEELAARLASDGVKIVPYFRIYEDVALLPEGSCLWIDPDKVNYALVLKAPKTVRIFRKTNPTILAKAVKNPTEAEHMRKAHMTDAVAMIRFIRWIKEHAGEDGVTELSAAEKLEEFRRAGEHYVGPSFEPIVGYAHHAAIIHYSATEQTDIPIGAKGMVLVDSGGQYLEGTTDITRTIVLGETTREEKEFFTRVLRGNLALAAAYFKQGCCGMNFDYLARAPLWEIGEDYNHGTGHGVGFLLNVHEGPNSFHYRSYPGRRPDTELIPGMVTSDEPGYYLPGKFGIRHENLLLCTAAEERPCGQFLRFEPLTLVPFDLEAVLPDQMSERERELLNAYHQLVYDKISPLLNEEEQAWLKEATRKI